MRSVYQDNHREEVSDCIGKAHISYARKALIYEPVTAGAGMYTV